MAQSAIPLPASTVVLIRPDQGHGFEIYLNRRPEQMDTYAGAYVFPGGRVEASDWSTGMIRLTRGLTPIEAQEKLGVEDRPERCLGLLGSGSKRTFRRGWNSLFYFPESFTECSVAKQIFRPHSRKTDVIAAGRY